MSRINVYETGEFWSGAAPLLARIRELSPMARYSESDPDREEYLRLAREYRRVYQRVWHRLDNQAKRSASA